MKCIRWAGMMLFLAWTAMTGWGQTAPTLDRQVLDLFQQQCADCHGLKQTKFAKPKKPQLDGTTDLVALWNNADYVTKRSAANSPLYERVTLPADDEDRMPKFSAKEPRAPLTPAAVALLRQWIQAGNAGRTPTPVVSPTTQPTAGAGTARAEGQLVNSLGMKFVAVPGTAAWFSIWDTRVQDYQAFATATGRAWEKPYFTQGPTHPVVNLSWEDAKAFCVWLTGRERAAGTLAANQEYRLPTDAEWSAGVGLGEEVGRTPAERSDKIKDHYPWGTSFPPPKGAGNYDQSLKVDDFKNTSPVGSFAANRLGLFDMGGNVWQWCEDEYFAPGEGGNNKGARVLRGASRGDSSEGYLRSSGRSKRLPAFRYFNLGFRVVVAGVSAR